MVRYGVVFDPAFFTKCKEPSWLGMDPVKVWTSIWVVLLLVFDPGSLLSIKNPHG